MPRAKGRGREKAGVRAARVGSSVEELREESTVREKVGVGTRPPSALGGQEEKPASSTEKGRLAPTGSWEEGQVKEKLGGV